MIPIRKDGEGESQEEQGGLVVLRPLGVWSQSSLYLD